MKVLHERESTAYCGESGPILGKPGVRSQPKTAERWRWPLLLLACSAAVLVSFCHTLLLMVDTWYRSRTYSHCFLILPLFLYLVWARRERLAGLKPAPDNWGLLLLGGLAFIWLLGNLGEVRVVQELAVVSIMVVMVWTLLGTAVVRAFAFPLMFLFFAVPFGTSMIRPLQNFTAWFVIHALTISNVPAVLENHTISLPSSVWTVAEACSGIRFLLSSVVLGTVFSFLVYQSPRRRFIFMCASIVTPIVGNGLRAYGTILLAYATTNKLAAGVDHIVYGGFFAVLIQLLLMAVGLRWRQRAEPIKGIAPDACAVDILKTNDDCAPTKAALFAAAAVCALVVVAPLVAAHLWNRAPATTEWADPPVIVSAPWQVAAGGDVSWAPERHGPDREFRESYKCGIRRVDLDWVLYSGRHGMDFGAAPDGIANAKSWALAADGMGSAMVGGRRIKVSQSLIESGETSRAVWSWYYVSGEYTASRARVRLLQAKARLLGRPAGVAVISLGADNLMNALDTERALQEFLLHASFLTMVP